MTIYEIKRRTASTSPYYFSRKTMRYFGQTLRSFRVYKQPDGRYMIKASIMDRGIQRGYSVRYFNPSNNELELN